MSIGPSRKKIFKSEPMTDEAPISEIVGRQCYRLMLRLRQTVPFPKPTLEVVYGLLPPTLRDTSNANLIDAGANLRLTMQWSHTVHAVIADVEDWRAMISQEREFSRVFWMHTEDAVPAPDTLTSPYRFFETHPHFTAVSRWEQIAVRLQAQIEEELEAIRKVAKCVESPALLRRLWPELMNFVKLEGPSVMHLPKQVVETARYQAREVLCDEQLMHRTIHHLSAALLLEDVNVDAWVSFRTR